MKTIYNHQLFEELKANPSWDTLFDNNKIKNNEIPILSGGLDKITQTKKYITFHDIGCNGHDNSFRIGDNPQEEEVITENTMEEQMKMSQIIRLIVLAIAAFSLGICMAMINHYVKDKFLILNIVMFVSIIVRIIFDFIFM